MADTDDINDPEVGKDVADEDGLDVSATDEAIVNEDVENEEGVELPDSDAADDVRLASLIPDTVLGAAVAPVKRSSFRILTPLLGLIFALGAGGLGGFATHKYFETPPPPPDLSAFESEIADLRKSVKAQAARHKRVEQQVKAATARKAETLNVKDIDARIQTALTDQSGEENKQWRQEIAALRAKIAAIEIPPQVITIKPDAEALKDRVSQDETAEGEAVAQTSSSAQSIIDPRPELLAALEDIRLNADAEITALDRRIAALEAAAAAGFKASQQAKGDVKGSVSGTADLGVKATPSIGSGFPAADILAALKAGDAPDKPSNWLGKILKKHISVKRTDHNAAAQLLTQIEAALLINDWDSAQALSQDLPEPARKATEEWIASARR